MKDRGRQLEERIELCLKKQERLSLGEVEILRSLQSRECSTKGISSIEESELSHIEKKLGLFF